MMTTTASRTIDRAIENIERLARDAINELRKENNPLSAKLTERELAVGMSQASAELAYAALASAKSDARPDDLELSVTTPGFSTVRENKARRTFLSLARRIRDNQ